MSSPVNVEIMREIATRLFVPVVHSAFGDAGTAALRELLAFLPRYFAFADPEYIGGTLFVARGLEPGAMRMAVVGTELLQAHIDHLPQQSAGDILIELLDTGTFRVWQNAIVDVARASEISILYRFTPGREDFIVNNQSCPVLNPAPEHLSVFARPTFKSLADALEDYKRLLIRTSKCHVFRNVWDSDQRLFFVPGPELQMRRSLEQFLYSRLRDVSVLVEQVVDESHPVDVKVSWTFTRAEALIEIKWLGKSRRGDKVVTYTDQRARDGAQQLAQYLDGYRTSNPNVIARGHLVIIDGRRRGLNSGASSVNVSAGMYYENKEIDYNPKFHEQRSDFAVPVRMFAEPVCVADKAS